VLFARAMLEAAAELPPLQAVIGHSMGGASAMLAVQLGLRTETLVSIAAPARILGVLRGFARYVGLPPKARSAFIRQVEQDVGMRAATLDVAHYQLDMPGLIVHAEDDKFVSVKESQAIHEAWFDSRLLRLEAAVTSACWPTLGWLMACYHCWPDAACNRANRPEHPLHCPGRII
jgi:pimeloyl-ACP methyl ester carboxylesterase